MTRMAGSVKGISSFLNLKPGYGNIGGQGIQDTAQEIATIMQGNEMAADAGLNAVTDTTSAKNFGSSINSIAGYEAGADIFGSVMDNVVTPLGNVAISKFGKPKDTTQGTTFGTFGDYSGGLKNYDPGVWTTNLRFGKS
tara:strand:- start:420 stop:836 length:417 start_codon:yes stop_codon:yes gene_type:complete